MNSFLIWVFVLLSLASNEAGGEDDCVTKANEELRGTQHKMQIAEKALNTIGGFAGAIGGFMSGGGATAAAGISGFAGAFASAIGLAGEITGAPSEEVERLKCIDKKLDEEFKKVNQKLDELKAEMTRQFDIVKQKLDALRQTVIDGVQTLMKEHEKTRALIIEIWKKDVFTRYNTTMHEIYSLEVEFNAYMKFAKNMSEKRLEIILKCTTSNPQTALRAMTDLAQNVLDASSAHYPLMKVWCDRIFMDLIDTVHIAMACFVFEHKEDAVRKDYANIIGNLSNGIIDKLESAINTSKEELFTNISLHLEGIKLISVPEDIFQHMADIHPSVDKYAKAIAPWNEWVVCTTFGPTDITIKQSIVYVLGAVTRVYLKYIGGPVDYDDGSTGYSQAKVCLMACERRSSNVTKRFVQKFVKWAAAYNFSCPWTQYPTEGLGKAAAIAHYFDEYILTNPQYQSQVGNGSLHKGIMIYDDDGPYGYGRPNNTKENDVLAKGSASCNDKEEKYKFIFYVCF